MAGLDTDGSVGGDADRLTQTPFRIVNHRLCILEIVNGLRLDLLSLQDLRLGCETRLVTFLDSAQASTSELQVGFGGAHTGIGRRENVIGLFHVEDEVLDSLIESKVRRDELFTGTPLGGDSAAEVE